MDNDIFIEKSGIAKRLMLKLGWNQNKYGTRFDCDYIILFLKDGRIDNISDNICFTQNKSKCGKIIPNHCEKSKMIFKKALLYLYRTNRCGYDKIMIYSCVYLPNERGHHFGTVKDLKLSISDDATGEEIVNIDIDYDKAYNTTSILLCEIFKSEDNWYLKSRCEGSRRKMYEIFALYGEFEKQIIK